MRTPRRSERSSVSTRIQLALLALIGDPHGKGSPLSGRDLAKLYAETLGQPLPLGTLYTTLARLIEAGYVSAQPDAGDARESRYLLTVQGRNAWIEHVTETARLDLAYQRRGVA